jgi:diaminopimelate epimerase
MNQNFFKYQGAGNDFILIDNRDLSFNHEQPALIEKLCNRRFGIGADGLMCLELINGFDFKMVYYNADGKPSSMCGNGGRCIVAFAKHLGVIKEETNFLAVDGPHYAKIAESGEWVSLQMIDVETVNRDADAYVINTGSPHYIKFDKSVADKNVFEEGRAIRYNDTYSKEGININFVEDKIDYLLVRTYERGVEDETYACGTGVTAVALADADAKNKLGEHETAVKVLGGDINIKFSYDGKKFTNIFLEGPAVQVYEGIISY